MRHFMNKEALPAQRVCGEVIAICAPLWVEVNMSQRRHRDIAGLERKPFASTYLYDRVINGITKYAARQRNLARGEGSFTASWARFFVKLSWLAERSTQRSSPAAWAVASNVYLSPPETVSVTSVVSPGDISSDNPNAITCLAPGSNFSLSPFVMPIGRASII